jgi:hypothetical protein
MSREIWGCHSDTAEDSSLLGCYFVSLGKQISIFLRLQCLHLQGQAVKQEYLIALHLQLETYSFLEASGTIYQTKQCDIPEDLKLLFWLFSLYRYL